MIYKYILQLYIVYTCMCYVHVHVPIGSMYAIYGHIYHQYTPNVSIYTIWDVLYIYIYMCVCHEISSTYWLYSYIVYSTIQ